MNTSEGEGTPDNPGPRFINRLEHLIGLPSEKRCLFTFFGATIFPIYLSGTIEPWEADATLAAWAFNNHSIETLDGLLRLVGRPKYINHFGTLWVKTVENDRRFSGITILHA